VSTAAGLPDFRTLVGWSPTGPIALDDFLETAASRERYWHDDERFFRLVRRAAPTTVHRALTALFRRGRLSAVVTQNVDRLHQAAGLPDDAVIELHGSIHEVVCIDCKAVMPRTLLSARLASNVGIVYCNRCQGLLKSGSVMFGEPVDPARLEAALRAVLASDLLLVLGTSLAVAPASDLVQWARDAGVPIAIVNATPTPYDKEATLTASGDVDAIVSRAVRGLRLEPSPV
jgi:NAD-dependent deacetylase